jgi:hypothetical protein
MKLRFFSILCFFLTVGYANAQKPIVELSTLKSIDYNRFKNKPLFVLLQNDTLNKCLDICASNNNLTSAQVIYFEYSLGKYISDKILLKVFISHSELSKKIFTNKAYPLNINTFSESIIEDILLYNPNEELELNPITFNKKDTILIGEGLSKIDTSLLKFCVHQPFFTFLNSYILKKYYLKSECILGEKNIVGFRFYYQFNLNIEIYLDNVETKRKHIYTGAFGTWNLSHFKDESIKGIYFHTNIYRNNEISIIDKWFR